MRKKGLEKWLGFRVCFKRGGKYFFMHNLSHYVTMCVREVVYRSKNVGLMHVDMLYMNACCGFWVDC